jgi:hypothetical protein
VVYLKDIGNFLTDMVRTNGITIVKAIMMKSTPMMDLPPEMDLPQEYLDLPKKDLLDPPLEMDLPAFSQKDHPDLLLEMDLPVPPLEMDLHLRKAPCPLWPVMVGIQTVMKRMKMRVILKDMIMVPITVITVDPLMMYSVGPLAMALWVTCVSTQISINLI